MFRLAVVAVASLAIGAFIAPGAWAHNVGTAAGHAAEDAVTLTPSQERALNAHTRAVSAAHARRRASAAAAAGPQDVGQWGPVVNWPVVAVHTALLANGKVLAYASVGDNAT